VCGVEEVFEQREDGLGRIEVEEGAGSGKNYGRGARGWFQS
jgi:hypothetical protein